MLREFVVSKVALSLCTSISRSIYLLPTRAQTHTYTSLYSIAKRERLHKVLRIMCLLSLTDDGVESSAFEALRKAVIDSYGFEQREFTCNLAEH